MLKKGQIYNQETEYIPAMPKLTNKDLLWKRKVSEDVLKSRIYLGFILFILIVSAILQSCIFGCLAFIVVRLFFW